MIRIARAVAFVAAGVAIVWLYRWWTAPLVAGVDGPERARIPAGLAIAVAVALLGWWSAVAVRSAQGDDRSPKWSSMIFAFVWSATPMLMAIYLICLSNEVIGVWMFLSAGLPAFGAGLVSLADSGARDSGSMTSLASDGPKNDRNKPDRRRFRLAVAGSVCVIGLLTAWFGPSFIEDALAGSNRHAAPGTSDDFTKIRGEFRDSSQRSPWGGVGDCVNIAGPVHNAAIVQRIACSDKSAAYRIFQLADHAGDCAEDADRSYVPANADEGNLVLCLDYNWVGGLCVFPGNSSGRWHAVRDDCQPGGEKPLQVQYDVVNAQGCPTGGYPHQVRRFTVCTERLL